MNELVSGGESLVSLAAIALSALMALLAWFFVNRASVRASEQIRLLEALLEEQKRQNQLLRRLAERGADSPRQTAPDDDEQTSDLIHLVAER
ncbi:YebO family protein [Pantoea sp. 1.19]|uniref:YebO family protein n=1 Tax=Pantoea sp. 1.19 TaxID=1925589 RepID=UPI000948F571|nr:YebO family protein [Pantoea sp. 1.19]